MATFSFSEKDREQQLVSVERAKVEESIDRLSKDIQREEKEAQDKKALLVEDLDEQVKEKREKELQSISKDEVFRETNQLASKLADWKVGADEPVLGVSYHNRFTIPKAIFFLFFNLLQDFRRKKVKWI